MQQLESLTFCSTTFPPCPNFHSGHPTHADKFLLRTPAQHPRSNFHSGTPTHPCTQSPRRSGPYTLFLNLPKTGPFSQARRHRQRGRERHSALTHAPKDVPRRPAGAGPAPSRGHGDGGPRSQACQGRSVRPPPLFKGRKAPGGPSWGCPVRCLGRVLQSRQTISPQLRLNRFNRPGCPRSHMPPSGL